MMYVDFVCFEDGIGACCSIIVFCDYICRIGYLGRF